MILAQYALVFALAVGATYVWAVQEQAIPISSTVSTAGWALLSLRGSTITVYSDDLATQQLVGAESLQYFTAGMALLSAGALVLWFFGSYPPVESEVETGDTV